MISSSTKSLLGSSMLGSVAIAFLLVCTCVQAPAQSNPLSSWNEGPAKKAITDFVQAVNRQGSPDFVRLASASPFSTTTERCGPSSRSTSRIGKRLFLSIDQGLRKLQEGATAIAEITPAPN
jgi:hypothetical protein